jgi:hypothetical protein
MLITGDPKQRKHHPQVTSRPVRNINTRVIAFIYNVESPVVRCTDRCTLEIYRLTRNVPVVIVWFPGKG